MAGTLLLVQAKMKKWVVPASSKNTYIYQWVADSMQILATGHTHEATTATAPPVNLNDPELVYLEDFNHEAFTFGSPSKMTKTSTI
ncbi:hypothetical protein EXIGLDRAFT_783848 [Exidia glandulosa HHB12029]|uniref:Uncharacterized protein n=1 Tax=Exidia glandulosa HHB12029 TaxID=1314781 RepID=A0A166MUW1_EXIGL|nr:hypothetical protein EXIGLDRAFT_783848 [Exidia glandulosa HHB12029]